MADKTGEMNDKNMAKVLRQREFALIDKKNEEIVRLEKLSGIDPLTGIANEKGITNAVSRLASEVMRSEADRLLVVKADIRYFKAYDDLFSWSEGDKCLIDLAKMLSDGSVLRQDSVMGRLGGDDFIVAMKLSEDDYRNIISDTEGASVMNRLLRAGTRLHNERGDKDAEKFNQIASSDISRVIHALRLDANSVSDFSWNNLGMMNLNISSVVLSRSDVFSITQDLDLSNYDDRTILWKEEINPLVDQAVKVVKSIDTSQSRGALCDLNGNIIKKYEADDRTV